MANILITGGTGLVGKRLVTLLSERQHQVRVLTRNPKETNEFKWNLNTHYIDEKALENLDFIIHLAGAGIADKRWSKNRKKVIIDSRVASAKLLFNKVTELGISLKGFISASGSNYYGALTSEKIFNEKDAVGKDFLGLVCKKWEDAANQFLQLNIRVAILRTGIVLSKKGGALEKMKTPVVSPLGNGNQYISWVHIDDLCFAYIKCVEENISGAYNLVSPEHHTSKSFSKLLANSIKRPYLPIGVPSFLLQLIFGELAIILLEGSRLSSHKIQNTGFSFKYESLKNALNNL